MEEGIDGGILDDRTRRRGPGPLVEVEHIAVPIPARHGRRGGARDRRVRVDDRAVDDDVRRLNRIAGRDCVRERADRVRNIAARREDFVDPPEIVVPWLARNRIDDVSLTGDQGARRGGLEEREDRHGDVRLRTVVEVADGTGAIPAVDVRDGTRTSQTADGSRRRHGRRPSQEVADPKAGDQEADCNDRENDRGPRLACYARRFHAAARRRRGEIAISEFDPKPSHPALVLFILASGGTSFGRFSAATTRTPFPDRSTSGGPHRSGSPSGTPGAIPP